MVRWFREDESHRHEANYRHAVHVDYHNYDYEDYWRFRRGEKQLVSQKKVSNPPPEANLAAGFLFQPTSRKQNPSHGG